MFRILLAPFALLFLTNVSIAQSKLPFQKGPVPTKSANSGDVYGTMTFDLGFNQTGTREREANFFNTLGKAIERIFLKKEGQYILTIEVATSQAEVLARRALMEIKREESGWWIFNRVSKEAVQTEWYGKLLGGVLVTEKNNDLRVVVKSYHSDTVKFDWGSFGSILDLLNTINVISLATPGVSDTMKNLKTTLEKLISSYTVDEIAEVASFSFVKLPVGPAFPASGDFVARYKSPTEGGGGPGPRTANIKITTVTSDSKYVSFKNNKFEGNPFWEDVLAAAKIGGSVPVETALTARTGEGSDGLKKFLVELGSSKGYEGDDIGKRCSNMSVALGDYFSLPDRHAVYWALMHAYNNNLLKNKGSKDCADTARRDTWTRYGLTSQHLEFLKATPSSTPTPSVSRLGQPPQTVSAPTVSINPQILTSRDSVWQKILSPRE